MKAKEIEELGCPWLQRCSSAGYAADAIVRLIADDRLGFAAPNVRRLFRARCGFALRPLRHVLVRQRLPEDTRFAGALLSKLSQRGVPAPCSISVERYILHEAQQAGVLDFEEQKKTGEFQFLCRPELQHIDRMVEACLLPELLVDEQDIDGLLDRYRSLCTQAEQEFFNQLIDHLPDRRLALFVLPQRQMGSILMATASHSVTPADRIDFAIEIPHFIKDAWLRAAIEIDDKSHDGAQRHQDKERDKALSAASWEVERYQLKERINWEPRLRRLVALIRDAVPDMVLKAAEQLRYLPIRQRKAIQGLVLLPVAEAQISVALADLLRREGTAEVTIGDPQELGFEKVVHAVAEILDVIRTIHGMDGLGQPRLALDETEKPELLYYGIPSGAAWDSIKKAISTIIAPSVVSPGYLDPLISERPRPIDFSLADRKQTVRKGLHYILQNVFRKVVFRDGQVDIIERALTLRPVVGLLPTAAGKFPLLSACFLGTARIYTRSSTSTFSHGRPKRKPRGDGHPPLPRHHERYGAH
jgi:hypothetical protein